MCNRVISPPNVYRPCQCGFVSWLTASNDSLGLWQRKIIIWNSFACVIFWLVSVLTYILPCVPFNVRFKVIPEAKCKWSPRKYLERGLPLEFRYRHMSLLAECPICVPGGKPCVCKREGSLGSCDYLLTLCKVPILHFYSWEFHWLTSSKSQFYRNSPSELFWALD